MAFLDDVLREVRNLLPDLITFVILVRRGMKAVDARSRVLLDFLQPVESFLGQLGTPFEITIGDFDKPCDLTCGVGVPFRQFSDFFCDNRKPDAVFPRAGRLNGRIECK